MKLGDARKIAENVKSDFIPSDEKNQKFDIEPGRNVTLPNGRILSPEAQMLLDKSIVAKRIGAPASEEIKIIKTEFRYRWVRDDRKAGKGGQNYAKMRSMGFSNATNQDVEPLAVELTDAKDEIIYGDLILMKMPRERYDAHIKANMLEAIRLQNSRGAYMENASSDVWSDQVPNRRSVSAEPMTRRGVEPFIPSEAELNQKMAGS